MRVLLPHPFESALPPGNNWHHCCKTRMWPPVTVYVGPTVTAQSSSQGRNRAHQGSAPGWDKAVLGALWTQGADGAEMGPALSSPTSTASCTPQGTRTPLVKTHEGRSRVIPHHTCTLQTCLPPLRFNYQHFSSTTSNLHLPTCLSPPAPSFAPTEQKRHPSLTPVTKG